MAKNIHRLWKRTNDKPFFVPGDKVIARIGDNGKQIDWRMQENDIDEVYTVKDTYGRPSAPAAKDSHFQIEGADMNFPNSWYVLCDDDGEPLEEFFV